ncbi:unnamed protein product, partial [Prorocentrum cordatum]
DRQSHGFAQLSQRDAAGPDQPVTLSDSDVEETHAVVDKGPIAVQPASRTPTVVATKPWARPAPTLDEFVVCTLEREPVQHDEQPIRPHRRRQLRARGDDNISQPADLDSAPIFAIAAQQDTLPETQPLGAAAELATLQHDAVDQPGGATSPTPGAQASLGAQAARAGASPQPEPSMDAGVAQGSSGSEDRSELSQPMVDGGSAAGQGQRAPSEARPEVLDGAAADSQGAAVGEAGEEVPTGQELPDRQPDMVDTNSCDHEPELDPSQPSSPSAVDCATRISSFEQEMVALFRQKLKGQELPTTVGGAQQEEEEDIDDDVLEARAKAGFDFAARGALGSRFTRWLKANGQWDGFGRPARDARAKRRREWAEEQCSEAIKKRSKVTQDSESDIKIGRMTNLDQLIAAEGGHHSATAIAGAHGIAKSALERGAGWVAIDPCSKRMKFRHISEETRQESSEIWRATSEQTARPAPSSAGPSTMSPDLAAARERAIAHFNQPTAFGNFPPAVHANIAAAAPLQPKAQPSAAPAAAAASSAAALPAGPAVDTAPATTALQLAKDTPPKPTAKTNAGVAGVAGA